MDYALRKPCKECPFLKKYSHAFSERRLDEFSSGEFPCHKTADVVEDDETRSALYVQGEKSLHCAGALIYLEKRERPHQMMRISERLGMYDYTQLDMTADVR